MDIFTVRDASASDLFEVHLNSDECAGAIEAMPPGVPLKGRRYPSKLSFFFLIPVDVCGVE